MRTTLCLVTAGIVAACATAPGTPGGSGKAVHPAAASSPAPVSAQLYPSTYRVPSSPPTLIRHATVLTGTGTRLNGADVLIVNGTIQSVGPNLQPPPQTRIIDGSG